MASEHHTNSVVHPDGVESSFDRSRGVRVDNPNVAFSDPSANPLYVHSSDHAGISLVSEKLNGLGNFTTWRRAMIMALRARNKLVFVDGSYPDLDESHPDFGSWSRCISIVCTWINAVEKDIAKSIIYLDSARQMWLDIHDQFKQNNGPITAEIQQMLMTESALANGSLTMEENVCVKENDETMDTTSENQNESSGNISTLDAIEHLREVAEVIQVETVVDSKSVKGEKAQRKLKHEKLPGGKNIPSVHIKNSKEGKAECAKVAVSNGSVPNAHTTKPLKSKLCNGKEAQVTRQGKHDSAPAESSSGDKVKPKPQKKQAHETSEDDTQSSNSPKADDGKPRKVGALPNYGFSFKCDQRAEKRREFYVKLEEKTHAKEEEVNNMQAKSKETQEAELRKLRKSLNFKSTPMPNFYQEPQPSKTELKKIRPTRPKSPKLGRKKTASGADCEETQSPRLGRLSLDERASKDNPTAKGITPTVDLKKQPIRKSLPRLPSEKTALPDRKPGPAKAATTSAKVKPERKKLEKDAETVNKSDEYIAELDSVRAKADAALIKASELEGVIKAMETRLSQVEEISFKDRLEKEDLKLKLEKCEAEIEKSSKTDELNLIPLRDSSESLQAADKISRKLSMEISDLPEDLLVKILSFLPTREAVATSILSKQWKFRWMWLPNLEFDCNRDSVRDFINKNLPLHKAPVIKSLWLIFHNRSVLADDRKTWVGTAVSRGLQELDINGIEDTVLLFLPASLYTCNSLVTLSLEEEMICVDVPENARLPSLKRLYLDHVRYSNGDSLQRLLSCCPILEDLLISQENYDNGTALVIKIPSLKRLYLDIKEDCSDYGFVISTPSLKYIRVHDDRDNCSYSFEDRPEIEVAQVDSHLEDLFKSISTVRSLSLLVVNGENEAVYGDGIVFSKLENLKVVIRSYNWSKINFQLLKDSPNLQVLDLERFSYEEGFEEYEPIGESLVPECLLKSLKTFNFRGYSANEEEDRDFLSFIMKHACCLESISISS